VLKVMSASAGDPQPVFDLIVERARDLCDGYGVTVYEFDGTLIYWRAATGVSDDPSARQTFEAMFPMAPTREFPSGRAILDRQVIHVRDMATEPWLSPVLRGLGLTVKSSVSVPLIRGGAAIGALVLGSRERGGFSDSQVELLKTFAEQAVIAITSAETYRELRQRTGDLQESLEYQTATSDVLKVISRSTFDLQPVLDAVTETSVRLCAADYGHLAIRRGEGYRSVAMYGVRVEHEPDLRSRVFLPGRSTLIGRALLERQIVHVADVAADPEYSGPSTIKVQGSRTVIAVPLMREGEPIGVMALGRQRVEPFTERQIELVRTFADQAVIAIENTRLITETREALEQQTATAEILEVINRSPGDLAPVFDAMLEKAVRLCGGANGILWTLDGERARLVGSRNSPPDIVTSLRRQGEAGEHPLLRRVIAGEHLFQFDLAEHEVYHSGAIAAARDLRAFGVRTVIWVALVKNDAAVGTFVISRNEVKPFSDKEIALLQNFAAQAVIAMDNARLLNEIRQRQAELRVTFDNMGDGVAMFDAEQRLAAWNMNFQRLLDLPDALLAERPRVADFVRYLATHGEYGAVDVEAEVRRLSERVGTQWSAERTRPDGQVIEVRSNPVPGGGVVLIYSDITERKRAEAEIRAARDTAEKALQELQTTQASLVHAQKMAALGQLTAGIAHEIKNPLNFVNNFAGLSGELLLELKETTAPAVAALGEDERAAVDEVVEMLRGNLDKIAEHGKRADGIVKSMLEHSRGVSGERRAVDLNALIEEALNLAYHGARAQDASFNITLEREFDRSLAPTELAPQEMTRVFLNLFGNGFYATAKRQRGGAAPGFRPTLKVVTRDLGETVEVRVRDNGTGIAPEIRDKLFQPFVTTKPTGEGTGLGLSIAYDIVTQQHGGTISVDSQVGEFTEFTIRLPCAYGATIAEAAA
jgi:two-component system NtrC family sensor kinase